MTIILVVFIVLAVIFGVSDIRMKLITRPVFKLFKTLLPPLSRTEQEAMEAGDVWWDGDLFSGKPNWQKLHDFPKPQLNEEEQAFLDNEVETLLAMLDDYKIVQHDKDLPKEVWEYIRANGFLAMIIPKEYGGKAFSAIANSTIVAKISSRSVSAGVTVMVPNSLGPGELLTHYGTEEQKKRWLPGLADGTELPCFALTGTEAGSDAGAIPDQGVICEGEHDGKKVLGIRLNWSKRYITLAPVATVVGLAFKLYDPDHLLGENEELGITCALIPADHKGVETGERHNPLGLGFMNGTTYGKDVFIPLDWIIGGVDYAGKGWRMLVECLSAGRGISLPALSTASGHLAARMTGAYSYVRKQFGMSIGQFEGVQEAMARIGANTYTLESMRLMTAGAIDLKLSPSVVTAIAKYHMTELGRKVIDDAMDIHAGKGIQLGPKNYLGHSYMAVPMSITVEGANILTRNLMIFGQGATRCHPYVLAEMQAAADPDSHQGLKDFDKLLTKHMLFTATNGIACLAHGLSGAIFATSPLAGETAPYYKQLGRMSRALALCTDASMLILGGDLKRKEMISARLGDVLSQLYIASTVLKRYEDDGRQVSDLNFVHYSLQNCLFEIGQALNGFFANFPNRFVGIALQLAIFPLGNHYTRPSDEVAVAICKALMEPSVFRDRLTHLCYIGDKEDDATAEVERAFIATYQAKDLYTVLRKAQRSGELASNLSIAETVDAAMEAGVLTAEQGEQIKEAERLRSIALDVDGFTKVKMALKSTKKK